MTALNAYNTCTSDPANDPYHAYYAAVQAWQTAQQNAVTTYNQAITAYWAKVRADFGANNATTRTFSATSTGSYGMTAMYSSATQYGQASCPNVTVSVGPPSATIDAQVNGGSWIGDPATLTVDPGDSVTLGWRSTAATSCTATGGNGFSVSGTSGTDSITIPAPNTSGTYSISCTGAGGTATDSLTLTTRQLPNFSQPNITYSLSPTFSATTGAYDWIDVTFNTQNNGGSDTKASANYQFQFDRNRDGYEYTTTGSLGLLTVNQTVTKTERVTGNIPFGNARVQVTADNTNAVTETNEGDNVRTLDLTIPPPDPGLSLSVDKIRVRQGETATITWSSSAAYTLNCQVYGPNLTINPSGSSGTRVTPPVNATSLYTLECTEPITGTKFKKTTTVELEGKLEEI